jgi:hypothetical protein
MRHFGTDPVSVSALAIYRQLRERDHGRQRPKWVGWRSDDTAALSGLIRLAVLDEIAYASSHRALSKRCFVALHTHEDVCALSPVAVWDHKR